MSSWPRASRHVTQRATATVQTGLFAASFIHSAPLFRTLKTQSAVLVLMSLWAGIICFL